MKQGVSERGLSDILQRSGEDRDVISSIVFVCLRMYLCVVVCKSVYMQFYAEREYHTCICPCLCLLPWPCLCLLQVYAYYNVYVRIHVCVYDVCYSFGYGFVHTYIDVSADADVCACVNDMFLCICTWDYAPSCIYFLGAPEFLIS